MVFSGVFPDSVDLIRCSIPLFGRHSSSVAQSRYKEAVVLAVRCGSEVGFGELAPLSRPFYEEQFLDAAQMVLVDLLTELTGKVRGGSAFDYELYRSIVERIRGWSSSKFALDMAMADLSGRIGNCGPFKSLSNWCTEDARSSKIKERLSKLDRQFAVDDFKVPLQGSSIGDLTVDDSYHQVAKNYRRLKIKVNAAEMVQESQISELVTFVREVSSALEVAIDFNESGPPPALISELAEEKVRFFEAPYRITTIDAAKRLYRERNYRLALDEALLDESRLEDLSSASLFDIAVLKPHRFDSIASLVSRLESLAEDGQSGGFYLGGMYDLPIMRRAIAVLTAAYPEGEASDLGPDYDYFSAPLLPSVVAAQDGLRVVGGVGLSGAFIPNRSYVSSILRISNGSVEKIA